MYKFYIDGMLLPVAPSSFRIKVNDKDEEVDLMDGNTLSILNTPGLTEYSFEFMLPHYAIPSMTRFNGGFREPRYYIDRLSKLKEGKKNFQFAVIRTLNDKETKGVYVNRLNDINQTVSIVDYTIEEDAERGFAQWVDITLKQYIAFKTDIQMDINFERNEITIEDTIEREHITQNVISSADAYTVHENETIFSIGKKLVNERFDTMSIEDQPHFYIAYKKYKAYGSYQRALLKLNSEVLASVNVYDMSTVIPIGTILTVNHEQLMKFVREEADRLREDTNLLDENITAQINTIPNKKFFVLTGEHSGTYDLGELKKRVSTYYTNNGQAALLSYVEENGENRTLWSRFLNGAKYTDELGYSIVVVFG